MEEYTVFCYERKEATVQVNDEVYVWGETSAIFNNKLVQAERIKNKSHPSDPICKCGKPQKLNIKTIADDFNLDVEGLSTAKFITEDIEVEGTVTYVEETKSGFKFKMNGIRKKGAK